MKKAIIVILLLGLLPTISNAGVVRGALRGIVLAQNTDTTPPTLSTIGIGTNGTSWTFGYNEAVTCGTTSHCCDDFTAAMTTAGAITLSYASGSGSTSVVCTGSPTVNSGDTVANGGVDYTTRANGIEDAAGNDLASLTDHAVTNNSTQSSVSVTAYFDCNSATSGQSLTKGTGTVNISGMATTTGSVGNALVVNASWGRMYFPTNIGSTVGTIGFYINPGTAGMGGIMVLDTLNQTPYFQLSNDTGAASGYHWKYKTGDQGFTLGDSTTVYLELAFDGTNNKQSYRIDGGTWHEVTGLTGDTPSGTNYMFGQGGGYSTTVSYDQIMLSPDYQADLYSIRTSTSP